MTLSIKKLIFSVGLAMTLAVSPLTVSSSLASVSPGVTQTSLQKKSVRKASVKKARASRSTGRYARYSRPSQAMLAGLRDTPDPLFLNSSVALAIDQDTGEELFSKNADIELPIASVTKLMTALVIAESGLDMKKKIRITREDYLRSTARSKLRNGMVLTRSTALQAALMSSDNRAASALARSYPGGKKAFVQKMNETASRIGMSESFFADPAGLDNRNRATARDLSKLVAAAHEFEIIRNASTLPAARLRAGRYALNMHTTNRLIGHPDWQIGVQKTGYTTAAGRCMVVQSEFADRRVVMVVLDSPNSSKRAQDMQTMRRYVEDEEGFNADFSEVKPYEIF